MVFRTDEAVEAKHYQNPLRNFMLSLVNLLETDSQEAHERDVEKRKQATTIRASDEPISDSTTQPTTPPYSRTRVPNSFETPDNKRKISETSFGTRTTESTPNKLVHAEAKVQSLQNTFVQTIINELWFGKIVIPWAQGRHMFLTYAEFVSDICSLR